MDPDMVFSTAPAPRATLAERALAFGRPKVSLIHLETEKPHRCMSSSLQLCFLGYTARDIPECALVAPTRWGILVRILIQLQEPR